MKLGPTVSRRSEPRREASALLSSHTKTTIWSTCGGKEKHAQLPHYVNKKIYNSTSHFLALPLGSSAAKVFDALCERLCPSLIVFKQVDNYKAGVDNYTKAFHTSF